MSDDEDLAGAIVGIDPGAKGGIAFIAPDTGAVLRLMPMPDYRVFTDTLDAPHPRAVFLEKAQAFPKQGVVSVFNYGHHAGVLEGVLIALGIAYRLVPPREWTKVMHAGIGEKVSAKDKSLVAAQRWFPRVNLLATERSRIPHEGLIDALLIAEFGRRLLNKGPIAS